MINETISYLLNNAGFIQANVANVANDQTIDAYHKEANQKLAYTKWALIGKDDYVLPTDDGVYVFKPFSCKIIFYSKDQCNDQLCSINNTETIEFLIIFIRDKKCDILTKG